ncbi:8948_t:CDS:1, partial [Funneliformis geosporum]
RTSLSKLESKMDNLEIKVNNLEKAHFELKSKVDGMPAKLTGLVFTSIIGATALIGVFS